MATKKLSKSQLPNIAQDYIHRTTTTNRASLKNQLQGAVVEHRQNLLSDIRGVQGWNVLDKACCANDVETIRYLLEGFSTDQIHQTLTVQTEHGTTPMHMATHYGSTAVVRHLLDLLAQHQKVNLLQVQNNNGETPLHRAAANKRTDIFQLMLSSVSPDLQRELLSVKNKKNQSAAEMAPLELFCLNAAQTKQALEEATEKAEISTRRIAVLEREGREQAKKMEQMAVRQEEMQTLIKQLEIYIRTPFATDATGDQQLEGLDG